MKFYRTISPFNSSLMTSRDRDVSESAPKNKPLAKRTAFRQPPPLYAICPDWFFEYVRPVNGLMEQEKTPRKTDDRRVRNESSVCNTTIDD